MQSPSPHSWRAVNDRQQRFAALHARSNNPVISAASNLATHASQRNARTTLLEAESLLHVLTLSSLPERNYSPDLRPGSEGALTSTCVELFAMGSVAMYLEGPGQQRRSVRILSSQHKRLQPSGADGIRIRHRSISEIEVKTLVDEDGKIAIQADYEGFRFKYPDSEIPWSLVVG